MSQKYQQNQKKKEIFFFEIYLSLVEQVFFLIKTILSEQREFNKKRAKKFNS